MGSVIDRSSWAPEDRLLAALARRLRTEAQREEAVRLAASPIDWPRLVRRSVEQDAYPMVHGNLGSLPEIQVPRESRDELASWHGMNALRAEVLSDELRGVLSAFHEAGIPAIPMKGVTLAAGLYGDIHRRACTDVDILVPVKRLEEAIRVAGRLGFEGPRFDRLAFSSNAIEHPLVKWRGSLEVLLELHWGIMWGLGLDRPALNSIWADSRESDWQGMPARAMSPEWELMFLCGHAARSGWSRLKWLVDIAEYAEGREIDWNRLDRHGKASGWSRALDYSLRAAEHVLSIPARRRRNSVPLPAWIQVFPDPPARGLLLTNECANPKLLNTCSARLAFLTSAIQAQRTRRTSVSLPDFLHPLLPLLRLSRLTWMLARRLPQVCSPHS